MKRYFAALLAILLCLTTLTGCLRRISVNPEEDALEAIGILTSGDAQDINELLFGDKDMELTDDPLAELLTLSTGEGVGVNVLTELIAMSTVEVLSVEDDTIKYEITAPDMSGSFEEEYTQLDSTDNEAVTDAIYDYADNADEVTTKVELGYETDDDKVVIDYNKEFNNALVGGLVDGYEDLSSDSTEETDTKAYTFDEVVGDAYSYTCEFDSVQHEYYIPEILLTTGNIPSINQEIWDTFYPEVESVEDSVNNNTSYGTTAMTYTGHVFEDTLHLNICVNSFYHNNIYNIYNVDLTTGEQITDEELIASKGLTMEEYDQKLRLAIESNHWDTYHDSYGSGDDFLTDELMDELLDWSLSEEYLNEAQPYIGEEGHLWVYAKIATPAGAGFVYTQLRLEDTEISDYFGNNTTYDYSGHTYTMYQSSMTWTQAKSFCEEQGGHLVTINSQQEQDFITDTILADAQRNCYWTAGYLTDGQWKWTTGEDMSYTNWAENEPNNQDGVEAYIHLFGFEKTDGSGPKPVGSWNDVANEGSPFADDFYDITNYGFICEWDS